MDTSWWPSERSGRGYSRRRRLRPSIALIESLERRDLLTVAVAPFSATAGQPFAGLVATFTTENLAGTFADFHATILWDQAGDKTVGTIVQDPNILGAFDVLGTFTYPRPGKPVVAVLVTGTGNSKDSGSAIETVKDAQVTVVGLNITARPGVPFSGNVAQFFSANPAASAGNFLVGINWGDGSPVSVANVAANPQGGFLVSGTHTYASPGPYTTTIGVLDTQGTTIFTGNGTASVVPPAQILTPIGQLAVNPAGMPIPAGTVIGSFTDTNTSTPATDFQAVITWGNGNVTPGTVTRNAAKSTPAATWFDVTGANTYATVGKYGPTILVQDSSGNATTISSTAYATGPDIVATGAIVPATAGVPFGGVVATFTDPSPLDNASNLAAVIHWGDGHISLGTITMIGTGTFSVTGANTYASAGFDAIGVTISDTVGQTATALGQAIVAPSTVLTPIPVPVVAVALKPVLPPTVVGAFYDSDTTASASPFQAVIAWGDGHTTVGQVVLDMARSTAGAKVFDVEVAAGTSETYAMPGAYTATIVVQDNAGHSTTIASPVTVTGPAITAVGAAVAATVGQPFSGAVATFTDPILADNPGNLVATIAWGDGHTTLGTIAGSAQAGYQVSGANTYVKAGVFPIVVTIADASGLTAAATSHAYVTVPAGLTPVPALIPATAGQLVPVGTVVGSFYDSDVSTTPDSFQAVIAWGDGRSTIGRVMVDQARTGGGANGFDVVVAPGGSDAYAAPGSYPVKVTVQDNLGHLTTITSTAVVTSPALVATGTTFTVVPGQPVIGVVARFTDSTVGGASAVINWGDGDTSVGTVVADPALPGVFDVLGGGYVYPTAGATGSFNVSVTITDAAGQKAVAQSTAIVANAGPAFAFSGGLAPTTGTGTPGNGLDTNTDRPTFAGTSTPFAIIQLFARPGGIDATIPLGQTVAGPAGQWSLTVGPLLDGYYAITATVTPPGGYPAAGQPLANGGLVVVDTAPPQVDSVVVQRNGNQVVVTFSDGLSGLDLASVTNPSHYAFVGPRGVLITPAAVAIRSSGLLPTDPVSVVLTTTFNPRLRGRLTELRIINAGITDRAGNQLFGDFRGVFAPLNTGRHTVAITRPVKRHR